MPVMLVHLFELEKINENHKIITRKSNENDET